MKTPEELRENFWKEDRENSSIIRTQYDEIKAILTAGDIRWTEQKYLEIKRYAIAHTEYYNGYSEDDSFPVVNKSTLLAHYDAHKSSEKFDNPLHFSSTSGSTGTPFTSVQNYEKRQRTIADLKVFGELCDYPSHERMLLFRATTKNRTPEQEEKENIFYIDCGRLGPADLCKMYEKIITIKPRILFSYPSVLIEIAKYIHKNHPGQKFSMTSLLASGENLSDTSRIFLESVFGCKVYRRYSDMELGILGQDMADGGKYILNWGSYYFECLKLDSDEPTADGEIGRIVITDLFNKALPMIRYDTGDYGIMEKGKIGLPCFSTILGRSSDCVYSTSGTLISSQKVFFLMWGYPLILQWQFVQDSKTDYHFNINTAHELDCTQIIRKFKSYLGEDANIKIRYVDEIPVLSSGKRRPIICNYKKGA